MCIGLETVDADTEPTRLNSVSVTNVAKFFLKCVMALHCILNQGCVVKMKPPRKSIPLSNLWFISLLGHNVLFFFR